MAALPGLLELSGGRKDALGKRGDVQSHRSISALTAVLVRSPQILHGLIETQWGDEGGYLSGRCRLGMRVMSGKYQ